MRSFAALTDHDFELLIADLFGDEENVRYEAFARGPDLGVDLRREANNGGWDVIQCKHYLRSTVSDLRKAARSEAKKLARLPERPITYRFITSRRLTRKNKRELKEDLAPFIRRQADIWGEDDLELLLGRHDEVERRHIKLWLPSSSQLQTLLAAGSYSRSRALAEEIEGLLARWVPSQAFFTARELLREQGVCVIAGVPGIGKTTLAKMLLADAISTGYEAIAVSGDIEEAWKVYDPSKRQAFYYDDFLGRTALIQPLAKNEEDRLLNFMRRCAESPTTLFILTTREYILQQAQQLHEQLSIEGVEGRKFLLELTAYSRLDRARIFYNHAFSSNQLTAHARRALLRDRAYEAIIDHKAYNPRQIQWITGLSGHQLTTQDNAAYVEFAVAALDDPARIWRYGFEEQLEETQRALLLALASMPDRVDYDDLARAFEGLCEQADISTRRRAFERALEVLDDSFLRTSLEAGRTFITGYDPSVEDFLAGYLAASPPDAMLAVRGAVFFEQVRKLTRLLRAPKIPRPYLASDFVDAVERCLYAPSCSWYRVRRHDSTAEAVTTRWHGNLEDRIDFIRRMQDWTTPYNEEPLCSQIHKTYSAGIDTIQELWEEGKGEPSAALRLLQGMSDTTEEPSKHALAVKGLITNHLHYPLAFEALLDLRELEPELFDRDEWEQLRDTYLTLAKQKLTDWVEIDALDEIDDIEQYGERMDVELDHDELRETRKRVRERIDEATRQATEQAPGHNVEQEPGTDNEDQVIEALFTRLAGD